MSVRIWSDLAEQREPVARVALAGLYRSGQGVVSNLETALALYRQAAAQGRSWAERRRTSLRAGMSAAQRAAAWAQIAAFRPQ